jgi:hypothetical protein
VGTPELRSDAGRQALELDSQSRALEKFVESPGLGLMIRMRDGSGASIALDRGCRCDSVRREHCPEHRYGHRSTSHLRLPLWRALRARRGKVA